MTAIELHTDGPRTPEYALEVAAAIAESVRVINHVTLFPPGAIGCPQDAEKLICEIATAARRLPQFLGQVAEWLVREHDAGRLEVPGGEFAGNPAMAAGAVKVLLEDAQALAADLHEVLAAAASVASGITAAGDERDDQ